MLDVGVHRRIAIFVLLSPVAKTDSWRALQQTRHFSVWRILPARRRNSQVTLASTTGN